MPTPVYITANSVDISSSIDWSTVDLENVLTKEVSTLRFSVKKGAGQTVPAITVPALNDTIAMYDSSGQIFGGTVTEVEITVEGLMLTYAVTCTDWSYLFDGTLVKKNYAMIDPHDIVLDIVARFAAGKGFTTNHVHMANFLVPSIKFNYQQPTKCLESLAKLIGWDWYIDPSKDIHFFLGDVLSGTGDGGYGPIILDETSGQIEWNSIDLNQNLQNMKNSVYVLGGTYSKTFTAGNTSDVYKTDGIASVFALAYPYDVSTITVTLAGVAQSVGVDQQADPSSVQVLYNEKNRFIKFTAGAPTTGQTVKIYGKAMIPIVAHASDPVGIATFGEFQDVIVDRKITTVPEAHYRAQAEIIQFGHSVFDAKFNTLVSGCRIGQVIAVNLPKFGLTNYPLLIKRVEAKVFVPGAQAQLEYQIEAIGSDTVTFVDIMTKLLQQEASQATVDDSTVNENLVPLDETFAITETLTASAGTRPYKWGSANPQARYNFAVWK